MTNAQAQTAVDPMHDILAALPLGPGIDAEVLKPARLMLQCGMVFGPISELPRARQAGRAQTERELRESREGCCVLALRIRKMHSPALRLIEAQSPSLHPLLMADCLSSYAEVLERAIAQ